LRLDRLYNGGLSESRWNRDVPGAEPPLSLRTHTMRATNRNWDTAFCMQRFSRDKWITRWPCPSKSTVASRIEVGHEGALLRLWIRLGVGLPPHLPLQSARHDRCSLRTLRRISRSSGRGQPMCRIASRRPHAVPDGLPVRSVSIGQREVASFPSFVVPFQDPRIVGPPLKCL